MPRCASANASTPTRYESARRLHARGEQPALYRETYSETAEKGIDKRRKVVSTASASNRDCGSVVWPLGTAHFAAAGNPIGTK
jgi:hypothetical protein